MRLELLLAGILGLYATGCSAQEIAVKEPVKPAVAAEEPKKEPTLEEKIEELKGKVAKDAKNSELHYDLAGLYQEQGAKDKFKASFNKGVELDMARRTVDEILQPCFDAGTVSQVAYDKDKKKTNFDALVYQRDSKAEDKLPVLVMFYDNTKIGKPEPEKREAIIFKRLVEKYMGKISFVFFDVSIEPDYTGEKDKGIFGTEVKKEGIKGIPSIAMYSPFDLVKGETPEKNDGKMKQIDVLRGGPLKDNHIITDWMPNLTKYWIPSNLISPNNKFVWRTQNSKGAKWTKLNYNKR